MHAIQMTIALIGAILAGYTLGNVPLVYLQWTSNPFGMFIIFIMVLLAFHEFKMTFGIALEALIFTCILQVITKSTYEQT